jgi:hypothetical protein
MHKTITEQFHHWLSCTFQRPPAKGSLQYEQLQFAFFCGEEFMLASVLDLGKDEDACYKSLSRWQTEVKGFMETELEKGQKDG